MQSFDKSVEFGKEDGFGKGYFPTGTNELVRGGEGFETVDRVWLDTGGVSGETAKVVFFLK